MSESILKQHALLWGETPSESEDPDFRIALQQKANLETLIRAARNGDLAVLDCTLKYTGEHVGVITAVSMDPQTQEHTLTPLAVFLNGNPYTLFNPPSDALS